MSAGTKSAGGVDFSALHETALPVGSKVWFVGEGHGYTVQARDGRYIICTKPFNLRKTVLYTIVDLVEVVRGPENLVFGMGAETREQCEEMLERLNRPELGEEVRPGVWLSTGKTKVSDRHRVPLRVSRVRRASP